MAAAPSGLPDRAGRRLPRLSPELFLPARGLLERSTAARPFANVLLRSHLLFAARGRPLPNLIAVTRNKPYG
jgi:hypothetical protein